MKLFVCFCLAIAVVALAHESAVMDEATDLIQESAMVTAGAKTGAKVAEGVAVGAKAGAKEAAKSQAKDMVEIGTHEFAKAKVAMARSKLKKITMKLGVRHPVFLGETAGLADFASENAKYVKDGYKKLKSILKKIDEFEGELVLEKDNAVKAREQKFLECKVATTNYDAAVAARNAQILAAKTKKDADQDWIEDTKNKIATQLSDENSQARSIKDTLEQVASQYAAYWEESETRHQVRNVLMQALWLVCTGFGSFRHTEYCTNIRQQPDYDEPEGDLLLIDPGDTQKTADVSNAKTKSQTFGATMQPVWEQQKLADAESTNQFDGDMDMEKGFVNNKAPWGVDPAGMEARGTNDGGEELGESNANTASDGTRLMTSQEMSARLTFLLESTDVPGRIAAPLTALIQAFDSDDAAVQGGLVEALVDMDTAEGVSQSQIDATYYANMIANRQKMWTDVGVALTKKAHGLADANDISKRQEDMDREKKAEQKLHAGWIVTSNAYDATMNSCQENYIELDALIETMNEELTNIMRLNSLLRFLVVGDEAKCIASEGCDCNVGTQGTWTWRNRGEFDSPDTDTSCEDMTGQDIRCNYDGAYPDPLGGDAISPYAPSQLLTNPSSGRRDYGGGNAETRHKAKFCACEYGFFASDQMVQADCKRMACPGFGRIMYPGNELQGGNIALTFEGNRLYIKEELTPANFDPNANPEAAHPWDFDGTGGPDHTYPGYTDFDPIGTCSGEQGKEHGICNDGAANKPVTGKCTDCFFSWGEYTEDAIHEGSEAKTGLCVVDGATKSVKSNADGCNKAMPYHGSRAKCEEWLVPMTKIDQKIQWGFASGVDVCMTYGKPKRNFMKYSYPGKCVCNQPLDVLNRYYGEACELQMCKTDNDFYESESSAACYGRGTCVSTGLMPPNVPAPTPAPAFGPGQCDCDAFSRGSDCKEIRCPGYNGLDSSVGTDNEECGVGLGTCDEDTGRCACATGTSCGIVAHDDKCPGACIYNKCQSNCNGQDTDGSSNTGKCDRYSGYCMCSPAITLNGPDCEAPGRWKEAGAETATDVHRPSVSWALTMDKWGWSICPAGNLLVGIVVDGQGTKDALFNLESGICARPAENNILIDRAVEPHRCYHENWWKKFDTRGGKFCRRNYFLAGLFRSHCNSLYCIEMAKCCGVKRSIWTDCKWTTKNNWNQDAPYTLGVDVSDTAAFAVGFFRTALHTLTGLTHIRSCVPIWWGQIVSYKTRFD